MKILEKEYKVYKETEIRFPNASIIGIHSCKLLNGDELGNFKYFGYCVDYDTRKLIIDISDKSILEVEWVIK